MISDLFNFKISILNPILKLIVPIILLLGTYYLYRARNLYQGVLGKVVNRLFIVGCVGFFACLFRFSADYWFTSLKWGESLFFLVFGLANIYAVWPLLTFAKQMKPNPSDTKE